MQVTGEVLVPTLGRVLGGIHTAAVDSAPQLARQAAQMFCLFQIKRRKQGFVK